MKKKSRSFSLHDRPVPVLDLGVEHLFRPTTWSRIKLYCWTAIPFALAAGGSYLMLRQLLFNLDHWTTFDYVDTLILLSVMYTALFISVWRLFIVSVAIGASGIVYKSWFNEISVSYSNINRVTFRTMPAPMFLVGLRVWYVTGSFFVINFEFSPLQLRTMYALINGHLAELKSPHQCNANSAKAVNLGALELRAVAEKQKLILNGI